MLILRKKKQHIYAEGFPTVLIQFNFSGNVIFEEKGGLDCENVTFTIFWHFSCRDNNFKNPQERFCFKFI